VDLEGSEVPGAVLGRDEALTVVQVVAREGGPMAGAAAVAEVDPVAWEAAQAVAPGCSVVPWVDPAAERAGLRVAGPVPSRASPLRFVSRLTPKLSSLPTGRLAESYC
jgi:hypothetical protein